MRELGGRMHVFAHNGDLPDIEGSAAMSTGPYRLVGQTDSEHAFCALLARIRTLWQATALGIRNAFLNQPVEVAALRPPFSAALG